MKSCLTRLCASIVLRSRMCRDSRWPITNWPSIVRRASQQASRWRRRATGSGNRNAFCRAPGSFDAPVATILTTFPGGGSDRALQPGLSRLPSGGHGASAIHGRVASHKANANCVSCHMPKRRTDDGVHIVMTEHLISRRPPAGDLLAEKPERAETQADFLSGRGGTLLPRQTLRFDGGQRTDRRGRAGSRTEQSERGSAAAGIARSTSIIRQARLLCGTGGGLSGRWRSASAAIQYFEEAAKRDPVVTAADPVGRRADGSRAVAAGGRETAPRHRVDAGRPAAWGRLGWALWQQNKAGDARAALEKAISLGPEVPELYNNLGLVLWGTGDRAAAEKEFRAALRIQPGVAEWRLNLGARWRRRAKSRRHGSRWRRASA